jgi:GAF domain-containing protein
MAEEAVYPMTSQILAGLRSLAEKGIPRSDLLAKAVQILATARSTYNWVGIYLREGDTLVLGPFVGEPTEHVQIPIGEGICGLAARTAATVNVPDVRQDPRYLACFPHTRSELVVPIIAEGQVVGEIDIDSDTPAAFTKEDEDLVNGVAGLLARYWGSGG